MKKDEKIERKIQFIKDDSRLEGLVVDDKEEKLLRKVAYGEISEEGARKMLIEELRTKHGIA